MLRETDYVSIEDAIMLKQIGFKEEVMASYKLYPVEDPVFYKYSLKIHGADMAMDFNSDDCPLKSAGYEFYSAPTLLEACDWLHEHYGLFCQVSFDTYGKYSIRIYNVNREALVGEVDWFRHPLTALRNVVHSAIKMVVDRKNFSYNNKYN